MDRTTALNTKVNFGRYKGCTLGEIARNNKSYVNWLSGITHNPKVKEACQVILKCY